MRPRHSASRPIPVLTPASRRASRPGRANDVVLAANTGAQPYANAVQPQGGALQPLKVPSGAQSGIKLNANFTVQPDQVTDLLLDFDACKSVVVAGNSGQYLLKPVIRVEPKAVTAIQGYVATDLVAGPTAVSAQQDGQVVRSTVPELFPTAQSCIAGRSGDTVVVTGSVYLIGEVLAQIDPDRGANEGRLQDF